MIGNLLESFDIMICAYLAQFISSTFFPPTSSNKNLYYTLIIFLVGYVSRPLGSIFVGLFADQVGRKKILVYSILITGICTAVIGLIPAYESIGYAATFLFLFFRVMQNVFVGGEYISSISYLVESAEENKRGYFGSWVSVGFNGGTLLASLSVYIMMCGINNQYLPEWGWRAIFFIALAGTAVGIWIRNSLPESLGFVLNNSSSRKRMKYDILKSSISLIKLNPLRCLSLMAITWLGVSETSAIFVYSPIHMYTFNNLSQQNALEINTLSLFWLTVLIPFFGNLYDKFNRVTLLTIVTIIFILFSPIYFYYLSYGTYSQILISKMLFSIPSACYYALATVFITESFPVNIRCTSLALIYQTTSSLAGGLTPLILLSLAENKHLGWLPAIALVISGVFCLMGLNYLRKIKKIKENPFLINDLSLQNPP